MTDRTTRRGAAWCALAVATTLAVTGCSALGGDASSAGTTAASSPEPASSASVAQSAPPSPVGSEALPASAPPASAPPVSAPPATGAAQQALASREFTVTGTYTRTEIRMRLDVTELKRRGDLLDLTATLTNLEKDRSQDLRWQVASRFASSYREDLASTDGAFSGAVLTDVAGKKRYLVAADDAKVCVCTVQLSTAFVGAGQSIELSATYAAPPTSTTQLDVAITSLGTFRDLPVS